MRQVLAWENDGLGREASVDVVSLDEQVPGTCPCLSKVPEWGTLVTLLTKFLGAQVHSPVLQLLQPTNFGTAVQQQNSQTQPQLLNSLLCILCYLLLIFVY